MALVWFLLLPSRFVTPWLSVTALIRPLKNPVNDSRDMRDLLQDLGFHVTHLEDASKRQIEDAIRGLGRALRQSGGLGLFYYAGHGMQVDGRNYLIPVAARITAEHEIEYEAVNADRVLSEMAAAENRVNIVILDACRDNPFARSFRSSVQGLAPLSRVPARTLIAYSTDPGCTAMDGAGRNSPYTGALLKFLKEPGCSITRVLQKVCKEVNETTKRCQNPWQLSSLTDEVILVAAGSAFYSIPVADDVSSTPVTGSLIVKTRPSGAEIIVDKRSRGRSPLTLESLDPGRFKVRVELTGYEPAAKTVLIRTGRKSNLTLLLDKIVTTGRLKISSDPTGAEWYLDGAYVGLTPDILRDVEKGSHKISVNKSGYQKWTTTATVYSKKETPVVAGLEKITVKKYQTTEYLPGKSVTSASSSGDTFTDPTTGMEFVWVEGGCFQMGSPSSERCRNSDEGPVHEVCVDGFWMGKCEVTNAEYRRYKSGHNSGSFEGISMNGSNQPVVEVSWKDAVAFAEWLSRKDGRNFRLPTEAEWEYACRCGGRNEKYSGGNDVYQVAWVMSNSGSMTHAAGGKPANSFGLYDMSGNVWEWCADWYDENYYKSSPKQNPQGASSGAGRVIRGGSCGDDSSKARTASRTFGNPSGHMITLGFRLAASDNLQALSSYKKKELKSHDKEKKLFHWKYLVVSGDTLSDIALKFNMTVSELKEINSMKSDWIFPDMILLLRKNNQGRVKQ